MRLHGVYFSLDAAAIATWDEYAAVLLTSDLLRAIAKQHTEMVQHLQLGFALADEEHEDHFAKQQSFISGEVVQSPIDAIAHDSAIGSDLRKAASDLVDTFRREVARIYCVLTRMQWGNPLEESSGTNFSGAKSLVATLLKGLQAVHWDTTRWSPCDPDVTALLYCTPCDTAMLPRMPVRFMRYLTAGPPGEKDLAYLLRPEFFHSRRVEPGTLLLFRHILPHAGTANIPPAGGDGVRVVMFDMVVSRHQPATGESQHFIWQRLADAYRERRRKAPLPVEFLASLQQHIDCGLNLLAHYSQEKAAALQLKLEQRAKTIASYLAACGWIVPQCP